MLEIANKDKDRRKFIQIISACKHLRKKQSEIAMKSGMWRLRSPGSFFHAQKQQKSRSARLATYPMNCKPGEAHQIWSVQAPLHDEAFLTCKPEGKAQQRLRSKAS
ncbi:hypothetical protein BLX87_01960 [Bacillus sp. VT-16-64]|nr:hypothetical protein BLX87_01960 [Bacillus sp. VT-16-64]